MRNPKNRTAHGFGERLEIGTPPKTRTVAATRRPPREMTEEMKKLAEIYRKSDERIANQGKLIDMNNLLR